MEDFGGVLQPPFFYAMQFLCFLCLARVSPKVFDILGENGKYQNKKVRTTFLAAFPISAPKYALLVMFDEPKATEDSFGFVTAGWNAVPTGAEMISAIAPQLNIPANYDLEDERNNKIIEAAFGR